MVPGATTSDRIQEVHSKILHIAIEAAERCLFPENHPGLGAGHSAGDAMPSVRDLGPTDLDALLGLYRHLHTEDDPLPDRSTVEQIWNDLCASPLHLYLGVESAGELVSTCTATIVPNLTRGARP